MSFYHWFPSHPNESELSGDAKKLHDIGQELRIISAKKDKRPPQTDFQRISSVPDVWSQHRLFDMLLLNKTLDPSYLEYEAIAQREWRAMVAVIVLAESYGVSLQTKSIDLDEKKAKSAFLSAAYSMRPERETWKTMEIYYIEQDGREYPIAMSSPTVHLVPAKDAWQNLNRVYRGRIPFLNEEMVNAPVIREKNGVVPFMLGDPQTERACAMLPVHALMLKEWLSMYRRQAPKSQNQDILESYETDLAAAYSLNLAKMPSVSAFFASEAQCTGTRLWGVRVPNKLQIFLDRVFCAQIEQNSPVAMIPDTHKFAGGIAAQSIFSQKKANGDFAHFFVSMPVTETFWQLWQNNLACKPTYSIDCDYDAKSVELTRITASVTLGDIRFSKTYSASEIDSDYWRNLCTAGIWPRQNIADWTDYFVFCYEVNGYRVEPLKKRPEYKEKNYPKREGIDGSTTYYKLTYAPDICVLLKDRSVIGYFQIRERLSLPAGIDDNVYYASIDFGTSSTTLYGGLERKEPKQINGMNLWSLPLINPSDAEDLEYSRLEKYFVPTLPRPIARTLTQQNKSALQAASFEELKQDELAACYPSCVPMQTLLADPMNTNDTRGYLRDSWIYFRSMVIKRELERWPKTYSNLKWSHADPADQSRIRAILEEILVMLALEARSNGCGKIAITASYPLSFENLNRESYYEALNEMLRVICGTTGLLVESPKARNRAVQKAKEQDASLVDSITESEALFRFTVHQNRMSENYFSIDVGGGSADIFISLTDKNLERNLYSTSLGFGARKVLLEVLQQNDQRLLKLLCNRAEGNISKVIGSPEKYVTGFTASNGDSLIEDLFYIRIPVEADLSAASLVPINYGEAFLRYCAGTKGDILFLELKKRIAFYLGAMIWLSGMMLREDKNPNLSVTILFAGNGSKMLRWLDTDLERTKYFVYQIFQTAVGEAIDRRDFDCRFSTMPKEEVAYGSLLELPEGFYDTEKTDAAQVFFDREEKEMSSIPAYRSLFYSRKDIATDKTEFEKFLKVYRESATMSYEWQFKEEEYDLALLGRNKLGNAIITLQKKMGYFLAAVEVVSEYYLKKDAKKQSN